MRVIKIENNKITEVKDMLPHYVLKENETFSEVGEIGQIRQPDGTFIDAPIEPTTPQPTLEDRLDNIENTLDLILLKQEGIL